VVAKKLASRYWPGERGWVKMKTPDYRRRESELEDVRRSRERRQFPVMGSVLPLGEAN
jgi:hypothetical protein